MKTATGNAVLRAYSKAVKRLQTDKGMSAAATSAGFIIPDGQKRGDKTGFQIFVKVCRFSEALLKRKPMTGGLLAAILIIGLSGCKTSTPGNVMTHAAFTAAITLGEQFALESHPEATPYVRAAVPVVCGVANGTNVSAQAIVDALQAAGVTNKTAKLIINGSIALFNVVTANLSTNQTELRAYAKDLCQGMTDGLPSAVAGNVARARRAKALPPHLLP